MFRDGSSHDVRGVESLRQLIPGGQALPVPADLADGGTQRVAHPEAVGDPATRDDLAEVARDEGIARADLVFAGPEEAALVLRRESPAGPASVAEGEELARELAKLGPATVVVKLGALGALALSGDQSQHAPARAVTMVDPVGAGDAFVAGYLSEVVAGGPVADSLRTGNAMGAAVCEVRGDWEGLPTRDELAQRFDSADVVR